MWYWMAVLAASMVSKPDSAKTLPSVSVRDYRLNDKAAGTTSIQLNRVITSGFPGLSVAEVASQDGAFMLRTQGPGMLATSQFRGGQAAQTTVFWEGIPIGNSMLGQQDLALLPAALLGEIKLTPGSQGGTLGNQAVAGSLHFTQAFQTNTSWNSDVAFQTGSWGQVSALATAQGNLGKNQLKVSFYRQQAFNDFQVRDYFSQVLGYKKQQNARQDLYAARLSAAGEIVKGVSYRYHLLYTGSDREIPPTLTQMRSVAMQKDQALRQVIQFDKGVSSSRLRLRLFHQWEQLNYQDKAKSIFSNSDIHDWGVEIFWSRLLRRNWELSAQSGLQRQQAISSVYDAHLNRVSGQIQINYQPPNQKHHLTGSLRVEQVGPAFSGLQPFVGFHSGDSTLRWSIQASGHFRSPTMNDLFWTPGGNTALQPEVGWGGETGIETNRSWVSFKLNAYWRNTDQLIFWRPMNAGIWSPVNLSDAQAKGIEARLTLRWRGFEAATSGQYGRFTRNQGRERMPYTPSWTATQWFEQQFGAWHVAISMTYRSWVEDPEGVNNRLPGFFIADFYLKRRITINKQTLSISAMIRNFTNQEYQVVAWRAMPGINWGLSIQWNFRKKN